jgi:hypothetical protein
MMETWHNSHMQRFSESPNLGTLRQVSWMCKRNGHCAICQMARCRMQPINASGTDRATHRASPTVSLSSWQTNTVCLSVSGTECE